MLVFFVLLELLSLKVFNSDNGVEEIKLLADAYSFTEDDDYKTDIVCVGSSDMYSGFEELCEFREHKINISCKLDFKPRFGFFSDSDGNGKVFSV